MFARALKQRIIKTFWRKIYSIYKFNIVLLIEFPLFCLPNNKILTMLSPPSVNPIYKNMYPFFIANNLISQNQSGFKEGDSCINQLLSMTHDIYYSYHEDTWCYFRHFKSVRQSVAYLPMIRLYFLLFMISTWQLQIWIMI